MKEESISTKYRKLKALKKEFNNKLKKEKDPAKVFGENEVKKFIEDCEGSQRDIFKMIKWMRKCFGRQSFTPKIQQIIQKHLSRYDDLHESEKKYSMPRMVKKYIPLYQR